MRYTLLILVVFVSFFSCKKSSETKTNQQSTEQNQVSGISVLNYNQLEPLINKSGDKTYVVNFWATWCKPCVDELPYFEKVNKEFKDKNVEVLLVSLDFSNQIQEQLVPFIKNNQLTSEVVVLDDPKQNIWIDAIDPSWSGAIPATIIYNKNKRAFYEQSFDEQTLLAELDKFLN